MPRAWRTGRRATDSIRLLVRPGDYVFPGAPIALINRPSRVPLPRSATRRRSARRAQVRTISSSPFASLSRLPCEPCPRNQRPAYGDGVLDRLGAALCDLVPLRLPTGFSCARIASSRCAAIDYDGLTDAMFHMIRRNAAGSVAVPLRLLEVLTAVARVERDPQRLDTLHRHADLVAADAELKVTNIGDLAEVRRRVAAFVATRQNGRAA